MVDLSNAFTGAATGAGIGAPFGPLASAAGGLAGGIFGLFGGGKDKPTTLKERPRYSPEQQQFLSQILQGAQAGNKEALEYYQKILSDDPEAFADFERPAMEQFQQQTIPNILERINAGGGMNKNSGAVTQQLAQAGRGLSSDLASMRAGLKQNAVQGLHSYSQLGLQELNQPYLQGGTKGTLSTLAPAAGAGYGGTINRMQGNNPWQNFLNRFSGGI